MKKGDIKEFITSDGKSITISVPITDYSTPEDIRGETLSLLRSCIAEIEKSPTFRDWYDSRRDESIDYLTNEEERKSLLRGKDLLAGLYYVFTLAEEAANQTPEEDFDASLYYFSRDAHTKLEEYLAVLKEEDKKKKARERLAKLEEAKEKLANLGRETDRRWGRITTALAENLSLPRDPNLFDNLSKAQGLALQESDEDNYIGRDGKNIALTNKQRKIIFALSHYLSQFLYEEDVQECIAKLETRRTSRATVERSINLKEFDRLYMSPDGKTRPLQVKSLREELKKISDVRQVLYYGSYGSEKAKARFLAPLVSVEEELEDLTEDKSLNLDYVNVRYSPVFLYRLQTESFFFNINLIRIMGKKGSGTETELFHILLSDLAAKFENKLRVARAIGKTIKKSDYGTKEEYIAAVKTAREEALTYKQNVSTLLSRVTTDYSSTKQYKARFRSDLKKALNVLKEVGIIIDGGLVKNAKGEDALRVIFNEKYSSAKK